jgi:hypothetical protein
MKKQKTKNIRNTIFKILTGATMVLSTSCEKTDRPPINQNRSQLSAQEQTLIGKWSLKKNETYEIVGVDSTGQYICTLIGESMCDSVCKLEFKNEDAGPK